MNACTIATSSYLPHARVLARSFLEHHPGGSFTVLAVDWEPGQLGGLGAIEVLPITELGIASRELHRMAMIYDAFELSNALKPWLLRRLLESGRGEAAYFDADILVLAPLDDVAALARRHSIVLTPNATEPMPRDGRVPGETSILLAGVYNGGFVAVGPGGGPFLDWLSERLARECVVAPERALFVDQRWLDLVPGLFDHLILRDPTCNVAYWNLPSRELTWTGGRYEVDRRPLRFFHFSGFDPTDPFLLSRFQGSSPRILLSERPALARLCREYAGLLADAGHRAGERRRYAFDLLPSRIPVDRRMRGLYREALLTTERDGVPEPPDPFDPAGADAFVDWLREPAGRCGSGARVSRYLQALWAERPDLRTRFPDLLGRDGGRYLGWVADEGRVEAGVPAELVPEPSAPAPGRKRAELSAGVNVVGYLDGRFEDETRRLTAVAERAGIEVVAVGVSSRTVEPPHDTNLVRLDAKEILSFGNDVGSEFFESRYSIGIWSWPLEHVPESLGRAPELFDELWVPGEFAARALAGVPRPVLIFPPPVGAADRAATTRAERGLPEGFLFLFTFDSRSGFERKNPLALVEAFGRAFAPGEGPVLLIQCTSGEADLVQLERLRGAAAEHPDVLLVEARLPPDEMKGLLALCDCYVSLHRAAWFGLALAEAMGFGKPAIATGYSGSLAYADEETSYLVEHRLVPIPPGCDPYPAGAEWAEPDVDHAARLMRHVYESQEEAREKGRRAQERIRASYSPERSAEFIADRLAEIRRPRTSRTVPAPSPESPPAAEAAEPREAALERASRYLEQGPRNPWTAPSPFGAPGRVARRLLQRALRPYAVRQHEFDAAIVEALSETATGLTGRIEHLELASLGLNDLLAADSVVDTETVVGRLWSHREDTVITPCLVEHGAWEPDVAAFLERSLEPGMTFVDVGANIGYFSVLVSRLVGEHGYVMAIEPLPENVALLRANLWRHGCANVTVLPIAAYSHTGHIRVVRNEVNPGGSWVEPGGSDGILVPCARLDDLLGGRRVDVVKVDAEGADHVAVRGMERLVAGNAGITIVVEFWSKVADLHGERPEDVLGYYRKLALDLHLLRADGTIEQTTPEGVFAAADPVQGIVNIVLRRSPGEA